jgi:hypothetical protein
LNRLILLYVCFARKYVSQMRVIYPVVIITINILLGGRWGLKLPEVAEEQFRLGKGKILTSFKAGL